MAWELQYKGQKQTLEIWGLSALKRRLQSEGQDEVTFYQPLRTTKEAARFDEGEDIRIFKDGKQWFRGVNLRPRRSVTARIKGIYFTVAGPWNYLTRLEMQAQWMTQDGLKYSPQLLLNVNPDNTRASAGEVIGAVLDYAIAQGVPITKGDILSVADGTVYPVPDEVEMFSCAAVIVNQMRWLLRQGIIWFDYSTDKPTMHIRQGNKLPSVTVDIPADDTQKKIVQADIEPRTDLVRPGVKITYEVTGSVDGEPRPQYLEDVWPEGITGREMDTLHLKFNMQGLNLTTVKQEVETIDINANAGAVDTDATRLEWWKDRLEDLRSLEVTELEIGNVVRQSGLPRMVKFGSVADWMDADFQEEVITAEASYKFVKDGVEESRAIKHKISCKVLATDAVSKVYSAIQSAQEGDPIPVGLARFLYELTATPQWEGPVVLRERTLRYPEGEVPRMGTRLNITNGLPEWATMNAVIQQVEETVRTGETVLQLAPASPISGGDLMAFLQVRRRRRWTNPLTQQTGSVSGGTVELGKGTHRENSTRGIGSYAKFLVKDTDAVITLDGRGKVFAVDFTGGKSATLDNADPLWTKPLAVRVVCVKVNGQDKVMQVLGSEPY
jgi:hypothetical protein